MSTQNSEAGSKTKRKRLRSQPGLYYVVGLAAGAGGAILAFRAAGRIPIVKPTIQQIPAASDTGLILLAVLLAFAALSLLRR